VPEGGAGGEQDSGMSEESLAQEVGPTAVSLLALVLSLFNLYLQRRDRRPRLEIRARYEYRVDALDGTSDADALPQIHDDSQEGLYLLLGNFLREHGLEYPQGSPVVRFALSNKGDKVIYLDNIRLVFCTGGRLVGERLVLDPTEDRVIPLELGEGIANILGQGRLPVELVPGDGVGYRFELVRLANTLRKEGYTGNIRISLEATDRLGNVYRRPVWINTDLWGYPRE
jgi:hypothetical protein